jgi:hypothetical protein
VIYIFDIDGTVAEIGHRLPHIQKQPADWDAFYAAAGKDAPIWEVITIARALASKEEHTLLMVTGRSEEIRGITQQWLTKYRVPHGGLYMRAKGDHREDYVVKSEILDKILATPGFEKIAGVFEDRQQVVDMYRARGIRVFQVAEGKF